jgi:hypothetical protein
VPPKGDCGQAAGKRQGDLAYQQGPVWLKNVATPHAQQNSQPRRTKR